MGAVFLGMLLFPGKARGLTGDFGDALEAWHRQQDNDPQIRPHPQRALAQQEAGDAHDLLPWNGKNGKKRDQEQENLGSGRNPWPKSWLATVFPYGTALGRSRQIRREQEALGMESNKKRVKEKWERSKIPTGNEDFMGKS